jgi:hydrogenase maturation protease
MMMDDNAPRILVVGLGNPILGDDGVGWRVAEEVRRPIAAGDAQPAIGHRPTAVDVDCFALGGLSLMERLIGYDGAIVVDAITAGGPPGEVVCVRLDELPEFDSQHSRAAHDTSLQHALNLGRQMGAHLPRRVMVVGVRTTRQYDFSEALSPPVLEAVPRAAHAVLNLLHTFEAEDEPT